MAASLNLPLYKYRPLDDPESIRVLQLHPSSEFGAPLLCELVHNDRRRILSDPTKHGYYEAVSYTWGHAEFAKWIFCDDAASLLKITANVDSMLRFLRKSASKRYLWIDAICLNQADDEEKSIQVQLMARIYNQAMKVHIWAGEDNGEALQVFAFLRSLATIGTASINKDLVTEVQLSIWGDLSPISIEDFLRRPWFSRRWILQEVALSMDVTLHCGGEKSSWNWIILGLQVLKSAVNSGFKLDRRAVAALDIVCTLEENSGKILDLLWDFSACGCTKNEDRIFALNGLAKDLTTTKIEYPLLTYPFQPPGELIHHTVDYALPWNEVYLGFTRNCIKAGFFDQISKHLFAFGNLSQRDNFWPSWVPDWSNDRRSELISHATPIDFAALSGNGVMEPRVSLFDNNICGFGVSGRYRLKVNKVSGDWPRSPSPETVGRFLLYFLSEKSQHPSDGSGFLGRLTKATSKLSKLAFESQEWHQLILCRVLCAAIAMGFLETERLNPKIEDHMKSAIDISIGDVMGNGSNRRIEALPSDQPFLDTAEMLARYIFDPLSDSSHNIVRASNERRNALARITAPMLLNAVNFMMQDHALLELSNGAFGIGPKSTQLGDEIVNLDGYSAIPPHYCALVEGGAVVLSRNGQRVSEGQGKGSYTFNGDFEWPDVRPHTYRLLGPCLYHGGRRFNWNSRKEVFFLV